MIEALLALSWGATFLLTLKVTSAVVVAWGVVVIAIILVNVILDRLFG